MQNTLKGFQWFLQAERENEPTQLNTKSFRCHVKTLQR